MPRNGTGIQAYVDASDTGEGSINGMVNSERPSLDGAYLVMDGLSQKEILVNAN
jgi:hypothetical protein